MSIEITYNTTQDIYEVEMSEVGIKGDTGKSAYQSYLDTTTDNPVLTEAEWSERAKGDDGKSAYEVAVENGYVGSETDWLASLKGADGIDGTNGSDGQDGAKGDDGDSAYQVWLDAGNTGSVQDYLDSLKGDNGGIPEAPNDGKMYGRMNGTWVEINVIPDPSVPKFYVRPLGGSYGLEDGSSYENAWNGFINIDWGLLENNELNICGLHAQRITVQSNNVTINFNDSNESGYIDADGMPTGMSIDSLNNITLNSPKIDNAAIQNISFKNCTAVVNDADCNDSGNQSFQHFEGAKVTYNNVKSHGNLDESISGHDDSEITLNGIIDLQDNVEAGINFVSTSKVTINGTCIFADNLVADILLSGQNLVKEDMILTINNHGRNDDFGSIHSNAFCTINLNGGKYSALDVSRAKLNIKDAIIEEFKERGADIELTAYNSLVKLFSRYETLSCIYSFYNSKISFNSTFITKSDWKLSRCLVSGSKSTSHLMEFTGGSVEFDHVIFTDCAANKVPLYFKAGTNVVSLNNIVIDGKGVGRGIHSLVNFTINNSIIQGTISSALNAAGGSEITANNCNLYNNAVDTLGSVTLNDSIIGDPLFTNPSILDYSLQVGSPCIGAGITTTDDEGIDTVDWSDEPLEMTTKTQTAPFDVGAYVS